MLIPLLKVDTVQRLVYGRIDETPDRAGEVFDYASSKPHFEKWSGDLSKATDGKSAGNLRAMHGKIAAGLFKSVTCDDATKSVELCAHVVDDAEWAKVEAGVYTGFSPGGKYAKRWKDGAHQRYTALPNEISLVDLPCIPSATFTMVKGEGLEEQVAFVTPSPANAFTKALTTAGSRAEFAAIVAAAPADLLEKLFGEDGSSAPDQDGLEKRAFSADDRKKLAADGKAMPDGSFPIETKEDLGNAVQACGRANDPAAVKKHITARAKDLGATDMLPEDWEGSTKKGSDMAQAAGVGDLVKLAFENAGLREDLAKTLDINAQLRKRVTELEAQPAGGGPRRMAIAKGQDLGAADAEADREAELKKIHAMPDGQDKAAALIKLELRSGASNAL